MYAILEFAALYGCVVLAGAFFALRTERGAL